MSNELYAWSRFWTAPENNLQSIYNDDESQSFGQEQIIEMVTSKENVAYITKLIIERADPLRNARLIDYVENVQLRVVRLLESWKNIGKFDQDTISFEGRKLAVRTVSPTALLDHYNLEFVQTFAESILPTSNVTNVTSVVNPNGLYAQQERIIKINSKPVPFTQRSNFRRLHDTKLDQRIDETETFFYRMDKNPHISEAERKKTDVDLKQSNTYMDREGLSYRMKPKY